MDQNCRGLLRLVLRKAERPGRRGRRVARRGPRPVLADFVLRRRAVVLGRQRDDLLERPPALGDELLDRKVVRLAPVSSVPARPGAAQRVVSRRVGGRASRAPANARRPHLLPDVRPERRRDPRRRPKHRSVLGADLCPAYEDLQFVHACGTPVEAARVVRKLGVDVPRVEERSDVEARLAVGFRISTACRRRDYYERACRRRNRVGEDRGSSCLSSSSSVRSGSLVASKVHLHRSPPPRLS